MARESVKNYLLKRPEYGLAPIFEENDGRHSDYILTSILPNDAPAQFLLELAVGDSLKTPSGSPVPIVHAMVFIATNDKSPPFPTFLLDWSYIFPYERGRRHAGNADRDV